MENPFDPGYYREHELRQMGFGAIGDNVRISSNCTILGLANIRIGSNVRIDGYSTLVAPGDGYLHIGSFVFVGGYSLLSAGAGIRLDDFVIVSQGCRIYSRNDDYSGEHLCGHNVPERYAGITSAAVHLRRHVMLGTGAVVFPGVEIGEGTAVGALSLVPRGLPEWGIFAGNPIRRLKDRSRRVLELEQEVRRELGLPG